MRFFEKTFNKKYEYETVDDEVFGSVKITSENKLDKETLDLLIPHILKQKELSGEIKIFNEDKILICEVDYVLTRKPDWGESEKININLKQE